VTVRFIDLFSGIGGFRLGLEKASEEYECVWSCDWDKYANRVYRLHFGEENHHAGDVRQVDAGSIPDHDLLCAGFPCQAFSVAGKRKGFEDTRGTLFYDIARIAEAKRPPLLLLENVKGLLSTQRGYCFARILQTLDELGYICEWQVLNSKHFGVPQNRERVFIIGHLRGTGGREVFPVFGGGDEASGEADAGSEEQVSTCIDSNYWKGADKHGQRTLVLEDPYGEEPALRRGLKLAIPTLTNRARLEQKGRIAKNVDDPSFAVSSDCKQGVIVVDGHHKTVTGRMGTLTGRENRRGTNWALIVADRTRSYAGKGRSLESPKKVANALSSVQKDNLLVCFSAHTKGNIKNRIRKADNAWCLGGSETKVIQLVGDRDNPSVSIKDEAFCLSSNPMSDRRQSVLQNFRIRRLTPLECERLQGFPDGWTEHGLDENGRKVRISDTQRYRLLGNAVTVNVVEFLGKRILERCF